MPKHTALSWRTDMDKNKQINEFLGSLVELENAIEKTFNIGIEYGLISGGGGERLLSFYRLVITTRDYYMYKTRENNNGEG